MNRFHVMLLLSIIVVACLLYSFPVPVHKQTASANPYQIERVHPIYQIYQTQNIWTSLLLDTRNGRIWQIHWGAEKNSFRGDIPLNQKSLAFIGEKRPGRFTLHESGNMWNFLLIDHDAGNVWTCQFATNDEHYRGVTRLK